MNSESERPRTSSRLWVRTASVETQATTNGEVAKGELVSAAGDHVEREGAVLSLVLKAVAGVGAGQGAQRHHSRHETEIRVRFAGPDQLVYLIGEGEAPPRRWWGFAERLDRAWQIGDDFSKREPTRRVDAAWLLFSHVPQTRPGHHFPNSSITYRLFRVFSGWPTGSRLLHPADPTSPAVTSEPKRRPRNPQIPYTPVRSWATRKGNKTLINRELSL